MSQVTPFDQKRHQIFERWQRIVRNDLTSTTCLYSNANHVVINVSGKKFELPVGAFASYPRTLLGDAEKRQHYYDQKRGEYFFLRSEECFSAILCFYRNGELRKPMSVELDLFLSEIAFFKLGHDAMLRACMHHGYKPRPSDPEPEGKLRRALWRLFNRPSSSWAAFLLSILNMIIVLLSIITFSIHTVPGIGVPNSTSNNDGRYNATLSDDYDFSTDPFFVIETTCVTWFILELTVRFVTCSNKMHFIKAPLNVLDFLSILPYFVDLGIVVDQSRRNGSSCFGTVRVFRLFRILRVFKMTRHLKGMQILWATFRASVYELGLLLLFMTIGTIIFSTVAYYAEAGVADTQFTSIPQGFWWAIVTMTTVGYGDITPKGLYGKIVGGVCAVSGLLAIAMPVPVIVSNFQAIYAREKERPMIEAALKAALKEEKAMALIKS